MIERESLRQVVAAQRVIFPYWEILGGYASEGAKPLSVLPYPPDAIKQGLKAIAVGFRRQGILDDKSRSTLSLLYRAIATFVSDEEVELARWARAFREVSHTGMPMDAALAERLLAASRLLRRIDREEVALQAEFEEYLRELDSKAEA